MSNVAFLGTGLIGTAMAERMIAQGDSVTVWNRTALKAEALRHAGAAVAHVVGEAVVAADRVHLSLSDDVAVDAILAEVLPRLRPSAVVIDHSTTSPVNTRLRAARLAHAGVSFLHAPVLMSPRMCREGTGLILVSGPPDAFAITNSALAKMTDQVWYLGARSDLAAAYKLCGNLMIFAINAGLADVLAMANNLDVPTTDVLSLFTRFDPALTIHTRGPKMAAGDFSGTFELAMARKDVGLMLAAADKQPLIVLPALATRMDDVIAMGHGRDDLAAIAVPSDSHHNPPHSGGG